MRVAGPMAMKGAGAFPITQIFWIVRLGAAFIPHTVEELI